MLGAASFKGYDVTFLDRSVRPQDDFYHFALGGYEKTHPIPPDMASIGVYPEVRERVNGLLRDILADLARQSPPAGSPEQKLADFYRSGLDAAAIEAAGAAPVQPLLAEIDAVSDRAGLVREMARLELKGIETAFAFGAAPDMRNPDLQVAEAEQGGLSLPSRDYYLDPKRAKLLNAYREHVGKLLGLFGKDPAGAAVVLRLETAMAEGSLAPAELRDPKSRLHPMTRAQLAAAHPNLDWALYLDELGLSRAQSLNLATPGYFVKLNQLLAEVPLEDWKTWLRWKVMNSTATYLSTPFEDEQFAFSRNLTGATQKPERWKKMVALTDRYLGMALGKKFVEKHFSPEAKAKALDMIGHVRVVLRDRITHGWMSAATKKEALAKLDALSLKIGYPDHWKDYSGLAIERGPFFANLLRARAFAVRDDLDKIGKPTDRSEWFTTPATVNAFYDPPKNEICFPAGRLQPPFFDVNSDDALNYGATGATMGHEMSHGYDDEGSQYDAHGALRDWWTPEDSATFKRKADSVAAQMSEYTFDGQQNNGKLVEGEAIADQAGVGLAVEALRQARAGKPPQATADGFTDVQRFYLGYAMCRANHSRIEAAHAQMTRDPHPLGIFRVNCPLSNEDSFYEAFGCKPGDPMMRPPDKRIHLWTP